MKKSYHVIIEEKPYPNPHGLYNVTIRRYGRKPNRRRTDKYELGQKAVAKIAGWVSNSILGFDVEFDGGAIVAYGGFELDR